MSDDADYLLALEMQKRFMGEESSDDIVELKSPSDLPSDLIEVSKKPLQINRSKGNDDFLNCTQNLVHPQWETLDPTPDIFALFGQFDGKFFQRRLKCVTLEWSKRMYSCAGICYSRRNRFGMDVTIRLSEPLLKLRPRKDLIETLLHEMIHAYCFVLNIREGNGGHGPNFKKIMFAINKVAGTNITVYHTFHDEVNLYKQHWWRCNGICQERGPFFGYVKRTSNRAPGPNDNWYAAHHKSCGGTFMKIKGPDKPAKKKKEKGTAGKGKENTGKGLLPASGDLRKFFTTPTNKTNSKGSNVSNVKGSTGPIKTNGGGTMLINPKSKTSKGSNTNTSDIAKAFPPSSYPGLSSDPFGQNTPKGASKTQAGNLQNVKGLKDLGGFGGDFESRGGGGNSSRNVSGFKTSGASFSDWGRGSSLSSNNSVKSNTSISSSPEGEVDRKHLRDLWSKRFGGGNTGNTFKSADKRPNDDKPIGDPKRRRISSENSLPNSANDDVVFIPNENSSEKIGDEDVKIKNYAADTVITLSSEDEDGDGCLSVEDYDQLKAKINKNMTLDERQTMIKQEIVDDSINLCDDDIELIDDEYDDDNDVSLTTAAELADTSIIDEFFGEDTLLADFKQVNDSKPSSSKGYQGDHDIITCFICETKMPRSEYAEHLDGCEGISKKIPLTRTALQKLSKLCDDDETMKRPSRPTSRDILRNAGYTDDVLAQIPSSDESEEEEDASQTNSGVGGGNSLSSQSLDLSASGTNAANIKTTECPVCKKKVKESEINDHLDSCLLGQ